jgi:aspartate racemase
MKTIGLLGGTTWESTLDYYRIINQLVNKRLGKHHAARIAMFSVDMQDVENFATKNDWAGLAGFIIGNVKKIEAAGADCLLIGANTMHMFADEVQKVISIPLIHIIDATAEKIKEKGFSKVGLLGTKPTMELDFYKDRMKEKYGIETLVPGEEERDTIHNIIFTDLFAGILNQESRNKVLNIMNSLADKGAQGVILGCTEIPLLIKQSDTDLVLFDTTEIHASAAVDFALS